MKTKEELRAELNALEIQEQLSLVKAEYAKFKKLEGKCFKTRNNYSCPKKPSDYWWLYTKVVNIKPEDMYYTSDGKPTATYKGYYFQTDMYGYVSIRKETSYVHLLGDEITLKEFNAAWDKMISAIEKLP